MTAFAASDPCCICPPACATDDTGDTCITASCAICLHGCPAGPDRPCCRDITADLNEVPA